MRIPSFHSFLSTRYVRPRHGLPFSFLAARSRADDYSSLRPPLIRTKVSDCNYPLRSGLSLLYEYFIDLVSFLLVGVFALSFFLSVPFQPTHLRRCELDFFRAATHRIRANSFASHLLRCVLSSDQLGAILKEKTHPMIVRRLDQFTVRSERIEFDQLAIKSRLRRNIGLEIETLNRRN